MTSRRLAAGLLLLLFVAWPVGARDEQAETFIEEMIRGIGAREIKCPSEVRTEAEAREVVVVCATFDGDFESFEYEWTMHLLHDAILDNRDGSGRVPHSAPQSAWEKNQGVHERFYLVGEAALGVRFSRGYVLMAYR